MEFYQRSSLKDCFKALDTALVVPFKEPESRAGPRPPGRTWAMGWRWWGPTSGGWWSGCSGGGMEMVGSSSFGHGQEDRLRGTVESQGWDKGNGQGNG